VSKLPGINHLRAVAALEKAASTSPPRRTHCYDGRNAGPVQFRAIIPGNSFTNGIVRDAGLSLEQFRNSYSRAFTR